MYCNIASPYLYISMQCITCSTLSSVATKPSALSFDKLESLRRSTMKRPGLETAFFVPKSIESICSSKALNTIRIPCKSSTVKEGPSKPFSPASKVPNAPLPKLSFNLLPS